MERLVPRRGPVRRGAVPRAAREGRRQCGQGPGTVAAAAAENTGQGSGNGDNEVAQAFEALNDSSVASEENFYDTEE